MDDILTNIWAVYKGVCYALPSDIYAFLLRANTVLAFPAVTAHIGFLNRWRHPSFQSLLIVIGLLAGLGVPLGMIASMTSLRPWLIPVFIIGLIFLPHVLAFHCTPRFGAQKVLGSRIQAVLIVLFILNLI